MCRVLQDDGGGGGDDDGEKNLRHERCGDFFFGINMAVANRRSIHPIFRQRRFDSAAERAKDRYAWRNMEMGGCISPTMAIKIS